MAALSARAILDAWDQAAEVPCARRPGVLLAALADEDAVLDLPLGARNIALLRARRALFGTALRVLCSCPSCSAELEFSTNTDELVSSSDAARCARAGELEACGHSLQFRLPTGRDLEAAAGAASAEAARSRLIEQCVLHACGPGGEVLETSELPREVIDSMGEAMLKLDPLAELSFVMTCTACGHAWSAVLDLAAVLWTELEAFARRMLHEVDALALRYHWSESAILEMSSRRRQAYLGLEEG